MRGLCISRSGGNRGKSDSLKKPSERRHILSQNRQNHPPRTLESGNHSSATVTSNNDLRIYVPDYGVHMGISTEHSPKYAAHDRAPSDHKRHTNGIYTSIEEYRSAFEGMKEHYVDKICKLQLEKSAMKTALAKTTEENDYLRRRNFKLVQDIYILEDAFKIPSEQVKSRRATLRPYETETVKKDRKIEVLTHQLDDKCNTLDQIKRHADIKTIALESNMEQLEKENCDLKKRIENEIQNSKVAYETINQNHNSTCSELKSCKSKLRKCQEDLQSEREKYTFYPLHESAIVHLRQEKNDLVVQKAELEKKNSKLNAANCELKERIEYDAKARIQRLMDCEQEIRNENESLRSQLAEAEQTLQQTKQKAKEDVKALELGTSHIVTKFKNEAFSVQWNQTDIHKRIDQLSAENENLKRNITQQRTTFDSKLKEAIESNYHMQRLQSCEIELENANAKLHQCQKDLQFVRETNAYYEKQSSTTESKISKFQQITNEFEASKAHLQKEKSELNADIIQLRKENDQLKRQEHDNKTRHLNDYDALKNKLHHTEKIFKETELELESMRTSLQKDTLCSKKFYDSTIANLQQEKHGLEAYKADLEKKNDQMTIDIKTLQQRLDSDEKRRPTFADYDALQQKLHRTEKELKQTKQELEDTKTRLQKKTLSSETLYDSKILNLVQAKHDLEACKADLEKKNDQMTIDIKTLQQRLDSDEKRRPTFADFDALQQDLHRTEKDLKQTKQELEDTKTRLQKKTLSSETLYDSKILNLVQAKHDLEACKADLEKKNDQMTIDIKTLQQRLDSDEKRRPTFADFDALQQNLHRTEKDLKQTKQELEDTKTRLQKNTLSSESLYDSKILNLVQAKHDLEACKADLEKKNDKMMIDIKNLQHRLESDQKRGYAFAEDDALQQKLHRTEKELKQTELELEDTKTRLSKCMGDKLTNNNPNIVDLSDMNRPSKLADRYKELYDNQWTDAYEILEDTETEEERIIYILLAILIETKRFCDEENRMQMEETLKAITHSDKVQIADIPVGVIKYIKDCRKSSSAQDIKIKFEKYISEMRKGSFSLAKQALAINEYLNECFEICWLMSIQDPPVVLSPLLKHGVSFRTDLYCAYTVSGKLVDYIVWPTLLLHENGPTLTKGVAQGMKSA